MSIFYQTIESSAFFYEDINIMFPSHLHKQLELFYLLDGIVKIKLGARDFVLMENEVMIVSPNLLHSYETIGNCRFYIGLVEPQKLGRIGRKFYNSECLNPVNHISTFHPEALHIMNVLAMQNKKDSSVEHKERMYGYLNVLVDYFLEHICLVQSYTPDQTDILKPVLNYILEHYMENLNLDSVAQKVGISKYYLSKLFSEKIGYSFPCYLMIVRTDHAKELLKASHKKMDEIAYLCGFQSESSFFRNFKRITGVTPMLYRNRQ